MRVSVSPLAWVAVVCLSGVILQAQQGSVQSWITTTDEHGIVVGLEEQLNLVFGSDTEDSVPAIHVDEKVTYQRMEAAAQRSLTVLPG